MHWNCLFGAVSICWALQGGLVYLFTSLSIQAISGMPSVHLSRVHYYVWWSVWWLHSFSEQVKSHLMACLAKSWKTLPSPPKTTRNSWCCAFLEVFNAQIAGGFDLPTDSQLHWCLFECYAEACQSEEDLVVPWNHYFLYAAQQFCHRHRYI